MARHPHQLYFRNNSFLFFLFPRGVWMCSPPQNYAVMFPTSGWTSRVKHTPTATEETPQANSPPHHAVSLARQLLHNRAWLRERLSLHNVALSSSWGCHYQVETMRERDVTKYSLSSLGFQNYIWGEMQQSSFSSRCKSCQHSGCGHSSKVTSRVTNTSTCRSPGFIISGSLSTLTLFLGLFLCFWKGPF